MLGKVALLALSGTAWACSPAGVWPETTAGETATLPCIAGGTQTRSCSTADIWEEPTGCGDCDSTCIDSCATDKGCDPTILTIEGCYSAGGSWCLDDTVPGCLACESLSMNCFVNGDCAQMEGPACTLAGGEVCAGGVLPPLNTCEDCSDPNNCLVAGKCVEALAADCVSDGGLVCSAPVPASCLDCLAWDAGDCFLDSECVFSMDGCASGVACTVADPCDACTNGETCFTPDATGATAGSCSSKDGVACTSNGGLVCGGVVVPPVLCEFEWVEEGACLGAAGAECSTDTGVMGQQRLVPFITVRGDDCPTETEKLEDCELPLCPIPGDCVFHWIDGPCEDSSMPNTPCVGVGSMTSVLTIDTPADANGAPCPGADGDEITTPCDLDCDCDYTWELATDAVCTGPAGETCATDPLILSGTITESLNVITEGPNCPVDTSRQSDCLLPLCGECQYEWLPVDLSAMCATATGEFCGPAGTKGTQSMTAFIIMDGETCPVVDGDAQDVECELPACDACQFYWENVVDAMCTGANGETCDASDSTEPVKGTVSQTAVIVFESATCEVTQGQTMDNECELPICEPTDCEYGWIEDGACEDNGNTCGSWGLQKMVMEIINEPTNGGEDCMAMEPQFDPCEMAPCFCFDPTGVWPDTIGGEMASIPCTGTTIGEKTRLCPEMGGAFEATIDGCTTLPEVHCAQDATGCPHEKNCWPATIDGVTDVTVHCGDYSYSMEGTLTRSCQNGQWSAVTGECTEMILPCSAGGWGVAEPGQCAKLPCGPDQTGEQEWCCDANGEWSQPNTDSCVDIPTDCLATDTLAQIPAGTEICVPCPNDESGQVCHPCSMGENGPQWDAEVSNCKAAEASDCAADGDWPKTSAGDFAMIHCDGDATYYIGEQTRPCYEQGGKGNWGAVSSTCEPVKDCVTEDWDPTTPGDVATHPCETGMTGFMTSECSLEGQFGTIDTTDCQPMPENCVDGDWNAMPGSYDSMPCAADKVGELLRFCPEEGTTFEDIEDHCQTPTGAFCPTDGEWLSVENLGIRELQCLEGKQGLRTRWCNEGVWEPVEDHCITSEPCKADGWTETAPGEYAYLACDQGQEGEMSRFCPLGGFEFEPIDRTFCANPPAAQDCIYMWISQGCETSDGDLCSDVAGTMGSDIPLLEIINQPRGTGLACPADDSTPIACELPACEVQTTIEVSVPDAVITQNQGNLGGFIAAAIADAAGVSPERIKVNSAVASDTVDSDGNRTVEVDFTILPEAPASGSSSASTTTPEQATQALTTQLDSTGMLAQAFPAQVRTPVTGCTENCPPTNNGGNPDAASSASHLTVSSSALAVALAVIYA